MVSSLESYLSLVMYIVSCFSFFYFVSPSLSNLSYAASRYETSSLVKGVGLLFDNLQAGESIVFTLPQANFKILVNGTAVVSLNPYNISYKLHTKANYFLLEPEVSYNATNYNGIVIVRND